VEQGDEPRSLRHTQGVVGRLYLLRNQKVYRKVALLVREGDKAFINYGGQSMGYTASECGLLFVVVAD